MKTTLLFVFSLFLFLISCNNTEQKKKSIDTDVQEESKQEEQIHLDYIQLNIGNYWIYQTISIDSEGEETFIREDSVYIPSDTIIRDIRYFKYVEAPAFGIEDTVSRFLRDSSGYLIDSKGTILFSDNNFTDTLREIFEPKVYSINYIMEKGGEISVPAGDFTNTLVYKGQVWIEPLFDNWDHPASHDNYYANGVGKIKSTAFYITKPVFLERKLIRYNIN